jgi:hypothetical protein
MRFRRLNPPGIRYRFGLSRNVSIFNLNQYITLSYTLDFNNNILYSTLSGRIQPSTTPLWRVESILHHAVHSALLHTFTYWHETRVARELGMGQHHSHNDINPGETGALSALLPQESPVQLARAPSSNLHWHGLQLARAPLARAPLAWAGGAGGVPPTGVPLVERQRTPLIATALSRSKRDRVRHSPRERQGASGLCPVSSTAVAAAQRNGQCTGGAACTAQCTQTHAQGGQAVQAATRRTDSRPSHTSRLQLTRRTCATALTSSAAEETEDSETTFFTGAFPYSVSL